MRLYGTIICATLALAGCAKMEGLTTSPAPDARPPEVARRAPPERSEDSFDKERFYARIEGNYLARGLLRSDGGGPDVPFTDEMLARNFLALAFSEEFSETGGLILATARASTLHRWTIPVTIETIFGETVAPEVAASDRRLIDSYARRLGRVTGHPVTTTDRNGNFAVFVVHDQDLKRIGPRLKRRLPQISSAEIDFVENLPLNAYCIVFTSDPGNTGEIADAIAIIRAELPDAIRTACYHEELAQGLGLANDSDLARPSIFKDDDEFGRLTTHDELLLTILYDDRLTAGMTETEAEPIVRAIASALMAPSG